MKRCPVCGAESESGEYCPMCGVLLVNSETKKVDGRQLHSSHRIVWDNKVFLAGGGIAVAVFLAVVGILVIHNRPKKQPDNIAVTDSDGTVEPDRDEVGGFEGIGEVSLNGEERLVEDEAELPSDDTAIEADTEDIVTVQEDSEDTEDALDEYIIEKSDREYISDDDLADMSPQQLTYARNEIYARHGYIFQSQELTEFFSQKSWYHPVSGFEEGFFNEYEKYNAVYILEYQKENGKEYKPE